MIMTKTTNTTETTQQLRALTSDEVHAVSGALSFSVGFVSVAYYGKNEAGDGLGPAMPGTNGNGIHMAWEAWGTRNHIEGY
jgi:hypothetical protein